MNRVHVHSNQSNEYEPSRVLKMECSPLFARLQENSVENRVGNPSVRILATSIPITLNNCWTRIESQHTREDGGWFERRQISCVRDLRRIELKSKSILYLPLFLSLTIRCSANCGTLFLCLCRYLSFSCQ